MSLKYCPVETVHYCFALSHNLLVSLLIASRSSFIEILPVLFLASTLLAGDWISRHLSHSVDSARVRPAFDGLKVGVDAKTKLPQYGKGRSLEER